MVKKNSEQEGREGGSFRKGGNAEEKQLRRGFRSGAKTSAFEAKYDKT